MSKSGRSSKAGDGWVKAHLWAKGLLARPADQWVILDTETTGLLEDDLAEVVQIAILSPQGEVLLDTLVRPLSPIPEEAAAIHGITDQHIEEANAPTIEELAPRLTELLSGKLVVAYNRVFDYSMLEQSFELRGLEAPLPKFLSNWECAMERYAEYCGEWNQRRGSYRWQPLPGGDHTALGDCRATLRLIQQMAKED